jgi:mono/diheme cytochrome c family protein
VKTKLLLAGALGALALALTGCGAVGHEAVDKQAANSSSAKQAFTSNCGGCHVLKAAGTQGTTGPNLDDAFACAKDQGFEESTIRDVIRGQIDYASPPMPRELVKGQQADDVADFIATHAGEGVDCGTDAQPKTNGQ